MIDNRFIWIDWLKVVAIIGVLGLHSSSIFFAPSLLFSSSWYFGVFYESLSRFGIILFLMASGFLILRKPEPIEKVPKRFKRVFVPFVFWLIVYAVVKFFIFGDSFDLLSLVLYILNGFLNPTDISIQFWFVYMIIGLYVFAPILSKWILNSNMAEIEYFLIIWAFVFILQFLDVNSIIPDYFRYFTGSVGYFILGYYLAFKESRYLQSRKFGLLLFAVGTLICFLGTVSGSLMVGKPCYLFFGVGEQTVNACLQGIGLFIIVKNTNFDRFSYRANRFAVLTSLESYGMYLSNILVINILEKLPIFSINSNALTTVPCVLVLSFAITFVLIYILNKIPFLTVFSGFKSIL